MTRPNTNTYRFLLKMGSMSALMTKTNQQITPITNPFILLYSVIVIPPSILK